MCDESAVLAIAVGTSLPCVLDELFVVLRADCVSVFERFVDVGEVVSVFERLLDVEVVLSVFERLLDVEELVSVFERLLDVEEVVSVFERLLDVDVEELRSRALVLF